jgi:hypothetical protein
MHDFFPIAKLGGGISLAILNMALGGRKAFTKFENSTFVCLNIAKRLRDIQNKQCQNKTAPR